MFDLKRFRKDKNIKQIQIAEWFKCGQSNVSMLEKNMNLSEYQIDILTNKTNTDVSQYIIDKSNNIKNSENIELPQVPEIDKNDSDVMLSLLSIIKEQGETLKDAVSNKNQKYIEQQTKILEGIETLKNIVERREKEYEILLKKIDQIISANNISGQKKVV